MYNNNPFNEYNLFHDPTYKITFDKDRGSIMDMIDELTKLYPTYPTIFGTKETLNKLYVTSSVPHIKEYKVIDNKVVIVTFTDGSTEKAIRDDEDTFNIETALNVCILKKVYGSTSAYNKEIESAIKSHYKAELAKKKALREEEEQKRIVASRKAKQAKRKKAREQKEIDRQAKIMAKAFNLATSKTTTEE